MIWSFIKIKQNKFNDYFSKFKSKLLIVNLIEDFSQLIIQIFSG